MLKNPLQYSISTLLVVIFLVAIGISTGGPTWYIIGVIEFLFFAGVLSLLLSNLPAPIGRQMKLNAVRMDGTKSERRQQIERQELLRFKRNLSMLLLLFLVASNFAMLVLQVDQAFRGETYLVTSPEIEVRRGRTITESQYARELGSTLLRGESHEGNERAGMIRSFFVAVAVILWILSVFLFVFGYLGMLRTLASGTCDRAERYRSLDYVAGSGLA